MNKLLTIIIPFLNEGDELANTVESIRSTITTNVDIILINDASTDGYDYVSVAEHFKCIYIEHTEKRFGVAQSRGHGVELCKTPYFLLLDAHMRFYDLGWDEKLIELLKVNERTVLCSQTKRLCKDEDNNVIDTDNKIVNYRAAYISFHGKKLLQMTWNYYDYQPYADMLEVPCIIGAAYAMSKSYWQYLKGLEGLISYGTDEELLSIKVWREGGKCLLIKNWVVGHIYRESFPYEVYTVKVVYNRIYTAELLLPYKIKQNLFKDLQLSYGEVFEEAYELLKNNYSIIKLHKKYLNSIFTQSADSFLKFNKKIELYNSPN